MPYYDFKCTGCGKEFEENIPMSQTTMPACPDCMSPATEKLITGCAVGGGKSSGNSSCSARGGFT